MTASIYSAYETDRQAENDGTEVEFRGGVRITVRASTSRRVRVAQQALYRRYRPHYDGKTGMLPIDKQDEMDVELAVAVVAGWAGVTDRSGAALPCTGESVRRVMADLPRLRAEVLAAASMEETFRAGQVAAAGEDSPPASAHATNASDGTAAQHS